MGYYVRAFCTRPPVPKLSAIQTWLAQQGSQAILDDPQHAVEAGQGGTSPAPVLDLESSDWEQVALAYKPGKLPILVDCNRDDGAGDSLLREEVAEFIEFVDDAPPGEAKERVLRHLGATRVIIACQLPPADSDADGYDANGLLLAFFAERCGGIIQADGEGFYDGSALILAVQ